MTLDDLDKALQAAGGWVRVYRRTWSSETRQQVITLTNGRSCNPWELRTVNGIDPIKREYFVDARAILAAVTA